MIDQRFANITCLDSEETAAKCDRFNRGKNFMRRLGSIRVQIGLETCEPMHELAALLS